MRIYGLSKKFKSPWISPTKNPSAAPYTYANSIIGTKEARVIEPPY